MLCGLVLAWLGSEVQDRENVLPQRRRGSLDAAEASGNLTAFRQTRESVCFQIDLGPNVVREQVDVMELLQEAELSC